MASGGLGPGDLLGDFDGRNAPASDRELYTPGFAPPGFAPPGRTVDLSGASSIQASQGASQPVSFGPGAGSGSSSRGVPSSFGSGSYSSGEPSGFGGGISSRGPDSIEGGGGGLGISLSGLTPANIARQLASRPVSELVSEHGRQLLNVPRVAARAYSAAARRYLRPWSEFLRIRPGHTVDGLRGASRRGEVQVHIQRNVLANVRAFCPNYAFIFLATLFMFVCTSPMLMCMLGAVGGGWAHATRSESFRNRPWQLQIGSVQVPLGANMKMLLMSLPTLLFLHFFMGPVLWSAALCSGGATIVHAAVRDRDDDADPDDHGLGGGGSFGTTVRIRELP